ncbi:AMP-binding protein [Rhodoligotrophos ferricapiens]|uniref:AMP-binding protein n=1 Tax=Rhodoligotrophos ferricapiens TaxID=3069264 RepID=UPI00315CBFE2
MTSDILPACADQGVIPAEICVLRHALERHAALKGDETFAVFEDRSRWSFAETLRRVRQMAAGLARLGVRQGDRVIVMMPNCSASVQALFAINYLGAAFVPINPAYRGAILPHVLANAGAALALVHPDALARVLAERPAVLARIVVAGRDAPLPAAENVAIDRWDILDGDADAVPALERPIQPWDLQSIIYTSGTTGRSKGVLSSYMHSYSSMSPGTWTCTRADDRHLLHMPIFHIGGAFLSCVALCVGASIAVVEGFKTASFWSTVRELEVTAVFLLGTMATFLLKQPPSANDRDHPLRMVIIVPLGSSGPAFRERFGVDFYTLFNMTEISTPLISGANPGKANVCGRPRQGVELRLVDEHDCPVPRGAVGQLIIRTRAPWAMNHGYNNDPEATAAAWRNGWFHTGDAFIEDEDGDFRFVDRLKDTIRRRGENISSYEVEVELTAHPAIREAAAVAVPSEHGEDEVLAVISPVAGARIDPAEITEFMRGRVPHFMVPRYLRIIDDLPKTPTAKVEKHVLRAEGLTPDTWDRERAGIQIRADKYSDISTRQP